jgi:hypothetical protein
MSRGLRRPRKATVFYFAPPNGEQVVIVVISLASCSLLLLGTLVLLIREVRLRRALQRLVYRLLTMWRSLHVKDRASAHNVERADAHHSDCNRL